jgi:Uma2 family endonuclease
MRPTAAGSETIVYPDSDGKPMAENTLQFRWIVTIKGGLDVTFLHDPDVFVAGDLLWYPVRGKPRIRMAPDALVAFGRPKGDRGSYRQWEEGGIAPQVVFEILSPGNRAGELARKFRFYQRYGVDEYYIYDPDRGRLRGWLRRGRRLAEVPDMSGFVSPRLGIRFEPGKGPDNLAIYRPDGSRFQTFEETSEQAEAERRNAEAERRNAEAERRNAEAERRNAEAERQRADRYLAKLRELGIEPD